MHNNILYKIANNNPFCQLKPNLLPKSLSVFYYYMLAHISGYFFRPDGLKIIGPADAGP